MGIDVFYVPSQAPGRSYRLILQGLQAHPAVSLVDDPGAADLVFYHHQAWDDRLAFEREKLVFVDFSDDPLLTFPVAPLAYFKRSWPYPTRDVRLAPPSEPPAFELALPARPPWHHPTGYAVMDEFVLDEQPVRDLDLGCFLRPGMAKRGVVLAVLGALELPGFNVQLGPVSDAGRSTFDNQYLTALRRSKIVVTAGPDLWEGDSRTWEALASGALVIQDELKTPLPQPLVDGVHIVYFDPSDLHRDPARQRELLEAVLHFLTHPDEAARIGAAGRDLVLRHHRPVHRVDEMLRVVGAVDGQSLPGAVSREPSLPAGVGS